LCGFWKEPSNAAGASFAAFFLAKFIFEIYSNKFWKIASYLCLIAGFLTLSNAGYLSIGISSLIGFFLNNRKTLNKKIVTYIIIVPIIISMIWLALFSRDYFYKHPTENVFLLAITGVRSANTNENFDPTDGRFDLLALTYNTISKNFIGVGIQVTGPSGINSPAGAPLFWLFLTGIPGLLLISLRELAVYSSIRKSIAKCNSTILLGQAFFAILTQQAIYGSWMDPNYVIFASLILVFKEVDISVLKKIN
jgi:hypothetical protein